MDAFLGRPVGIAVQARGGHAIARKKPQMMTGKCE